MNAVSPGAPILSFRGTVRCEPGRGAVSWILRGVDANSGEAVTALFSRVDSGAGLPATLQNACIAMQPSAQGSYGVLEAGRALAFAAGSVQIHRDRAKVFYGALPSQALPRRTHLGWALLLAVLRIPGMAKLIQLFRGSR